ncbi:MAG: histidine phosphatase family protein, partial [Anaerolineae bacterium]
HLQTLHPKGVIAVFSHADIVKAAVAYYAGIHLDLFQRLVVDTASVSWIRFTPHGPRLLRLNDTGALEPPKPEKPAEEAAAPAEEAATAA